MNHWPIVIIGIFILCFVICSKFDHLQTDIDNVNKQVTQCITRDEFEEMITNLLDVKFEEYSKSLKQRVN